MPSRPAFTGRVSRRASLLIALAAAVPVGAGAKRRQGCRYRARATGLADQAAEDHCGLSGRFVA